MAMKDRIMVKNYLIGGLCLRMYAKKIYEDIEKSNHQNISLDFEGIKYLSRSFAHQLLIDKKKSDKEITYINISSEIKTMLDVVERSLNKPNNRVNYIRSKIKLDNVITL
jgi:hypothetical protein